MSQKLNSPQFESPTGSSDQEFTYMAIGMVAGAVPGIVLGLIASRVAYNKKKTRN